MTSGPTSDTVRDDDAEAFGEAILRNALRQAERDHKEQMVSGGEITLNVAVEFKFLPREPSGGEYQETIEARMLPRGPCCVCVRVGDGGRVCAGTCCD